MEGIYGKYDKFRISGHCTNWTVGIWKVTALVLFCFAFLALKGFWIDISNLSTCGAQRTLGKLELSLCYRHRGSPLGPVSASPQWNVPICSHGALWSLAKHLWDYLGLPGRGDGDPQLLSLTWREQTQLKLTQGISIPWNHHTQGSAKEGAFQSRTTTAKMGDFRQKGQNLAQPSVEFASSTDLLIPSESPLPHLQKKSSQGKPTWSIVYF